MAPSFSQSPKYTVRPLVYLKAILHAAKHPHAAVLGVLLGSSDGSDVDLEDAVPLVHRWTDLTPMIEAGLSMAAEYAKERHLSVIGVYAASPSLDDVSLSFTVQRVADAVLKMGCKEACALMLDNQKVGTDQPAFLPYTPAPGASWTPHPAAFSPSSAFTLADPAIAAQASAAVRVRAYRDLGDFDDHLEDIGVDWLTNPGISAKRVQS